MWKGRHSLLGRIRGIVMPQVDVNPDELDRFAKELQQFIQQAEQLNKQLQGSFSRVSGSWKDEQNRRFAEELMATSRNLTRFVETASQHLPKLRKQVDAARAYLSQR